MNTRAHGRTTSALELETVDTILNGGFTDPRTDQIGEIRRRYGPGAIEPDDGAATDAEILEFPSDVELDTRANAVIGGLLWPGDFGVLYGPSGCGKTFVVCKVGFSVATGQPIAGRKVRRVPVLYVIMEGQRGFRHRMLAAVSTYGDPGRFFARLKLRAPLDKSADGRSGVATIVKAAKCLGSRAGEPVGLIIIDTLARAIAGDDENSAQDVAAFIEHRVTEIIRQTGAAVLVIHHPGKDPVRGMRGSSALFGAADAVISIDQARSIRLEKVKDGADGDLASFSLRPVPLGLDDNGDRITTCVVDWEPITGKKPGGKVRLTPTAKKSLEVLHRIYTDGGARDVAGEEIALGDIAPNKLPRVVEIATWQKRCREKRLSKSGEANAERIAFHRNREKLEEANQIACHGEYVWLLGQCRTASDGGQS